MNAAGGSLSNAVLHKDLPPPVGWVQRLRGIVIGGSAGSIEVLAVLLPALPATLKVPVFIVVHLPRERPSLLTDIFRARCALPLCEAQDKEPVQAGTVYFAPPDYHLLLDRGADGAPSLALSVDAPVHYSRPAIDVLFESAADVLGAGLMGIVLSGGNEDGARGLARIRLDGGVAVVQTPSDAKVTTMPEAALAQGPVHHRLASDEIAALLRSLALPDGNLAGQAARAVPAERAAVDQTTPALAAPQTSLSRVQR